MKKPSVTTVTTVTSLGTHTHTKYARAYAHTMREIYLFIYFHTHTGVRACARGWREGVCVCPTPPGRPDFRVIDARRMVLAVNHRRCWVCGEQLGRCLAFVIGPMCAINRINSEPPSHRDCAEFAARACPFLTRPRMVRREDNLPEGIKEPAGIGLTRNPGVTLLWVTRSYRPFKVDNGWLFRLGDPEEVCWYCQGRPATRAEIMASVDSGLPLLRDAAEVDGAEVIAEIEQRYRDLERLLPQGAAA
jgi:hypothetical protein